MKCIAERDSESDEIFDLEADLEKEAGRIATRRGWWHRKYKHPGRRSAPDREFCRLGYDLYVEFKRNPNVPTGQQLLEIREMQAAGRDVVWLDSIEDFEATLIDRETRACLLQRERP